MAQNWTQIEIKTNILDFPRATSKIEKSIVATSKISNLILPVFLKFSHCFLGPAKKNEEPTNKIEAAVYFIANNFGASPKVKIKVEIDEINKKIPKITHKINPNILVFILKLGQHESESTPEIEP